MSINLSSIIVNEEYVASYAKGDRFGDRDKLATKNGSRSSIIVKADPKAERSWWEVLLFGGATGGAAGCGGNNQEPAPETIDPPPETIDPPPETIDPSQDCSIYPSDKILDELRLNYYEDTEELPGERETILNIITSIDYRFTEGLDSILVFEKEECKNDRGRYRGYYLGYQEPDRKKVIGLCRASNGNGGAFDDIYTLKWVIHHEVGHHVDNKIGQRALEFFNLAVDSYSEEDRDFAKEIFANNFAAYILGGPYFKMAELRGVDYKPGAYEWFKGTLFCGREHEEIQHDLLRFSMIELDCGEEDYDCTLRELEKFIQDFPDSDIVPYAKEMMGRIYAFDLHQCDKGLEIFEEIRTEYPESADYARLQIAEIYRKCLNDYDSALREYLIFIDRYPDSLYIGTAIYWIGHMYDLLGDCENAIGFYQRFIDEHDGWLRDDAMLHLGGCYWELGDYEAAIGTYQRLINEYPDSGYRARAMFYMGKLYQELGDCASAMEILQTLINEYPDFYGVSDALALIDECGG